MHMKVDGIFRMFIAKTGNGFVEAIARIYKNKIIDCNLFVMCRALSRSNQIEGSKNGIYTHHPTTMTTTTKRKDIIQIFLCFLASNVAYACVFLLGCIYSTHWLYSILEFVVQQHEHNVSNLFLTRRIFFCTSFILLHVLCMCVTLLVAIHFYSVAVLSLCYAILYMPYRTIFACSLLPFPVWQ